MFKLIQCSCMWNAMLFFILCYIADFTLWYDTDFSSFKSFKTGFKNKVNSMYCTFLYSTCTCSIPYTITKLHYQKCIRYCPSVDAQYYNAIKKMFRCFIHFKDFIFCNQTNQLYNKYG